MRENLTEYELRVVKDCEKNILKKTKQRTNTMNIFAGECGRNTT